MTQDLVRGLPSWAGLDGSDLLRTLVESLPGHAFVKDVEGRFVLNNAEHLRALGASAQEDVAGKTDLDFYPERLAARRRADEREILRTGRPLVEREEPVRDDGVDDQRWLSTTTVPLRDGGGTIVGTLGISRDVTERKEAREAVERLARRNESILNSAGEGIYGLDREGRTTFVNPAATSLTGFSRAELLGKHQHDLIHHSHEDGSPYPEDDCPIYLALRDGEVHNAEDEVFWRKDGTCFPVEYVSTPIHEDGEITGAVVTFKDITERKRAGEALKESEERYRAVVEQSVEAIYLYDAQTKRVLESNPAFQQMVGYTAEELRGREIYDFIAHRKEDINENVRRSLEKKRRIIGERDYRRKDGSVFVVETSASVIPYLGRTAICAVSRDLTERKEAEEALRRSEERFRSLVRNAPDVITVIDADNVVRYDSPAIERVLGYEPGERLGTKGWDYVHPDDLERVTKAFTELLERPGADAPMGYRMRHADGTWRHVEARRTNLLDDPAVEGVVVNYRDVTARKEAEDKLRDAEEMYRLLVERVPAIVYLQDVETLHMVYVSPQLETLLGYPQDTYLEDPRYWRGVIHPDDRERVLTAGARARERDEAEFSSEYRCVSRDGRVVWVRDEAKLVRDEGDEPRFWHGIISDVTERKGFEEALRVSERRLRTVIEQSPLSIQILTPEGRSLMTNVAWEETWNLGVQETPKGVSVFEDEQLRSAGLTPYVEESIVSGEVLTTPPLLHDPRENGREGSPRWLRGFVYPVRGGDGRILEVTLMVEDITERKKGEEDLRQSEERYRAVVEQTVDGIYFGDADTKRVLESNAAFQRMLGYTADELRGMHIYEFVAHERDNVDAVFQNVLNEGRSFIGERRYRRKNGSVVHVETSATVTSYGDRRVLCTVVRDITERKDLERRLRHQALHDSLTELPNRTLFLELLRNALVRAKRDSKSVAVLFVDLDNFKVVNDSMGHPAGNELLGAVAETLRGCVRPGDTVARLFGDEFAVLLENVNGVAEAIRVADRIAERLSTPFVVKSREIFVGASIGIDLSTADQKGPDELLRNADLAMYAAKSKGKARYEVFAPSMNTRLLERMDLENDLRRAIERGELAVYYQPIVALETGKIEGLEALVRWQHPEHGVITPSGFIPAAEQTGLILQIGRWVLEETRRQIREWRSQLGEGVTPPPISVNLSAKQFVNEPESVLEALRSDGLDPNGLRLEITERVVMDDAEFAIDKIQRLKGLGIRFAIDDFGTGYSCLHYLKRLPVDQLKIDRSFIGGLERNSEDVAIVSGTIGLAQALGLQVVAEGVETAEQLALLREMGCDLVQGNFLSAPSPGESAKSFLLERHLRVSAPAT